MEMGLFDFLFGKKITLEIPDQNGCIVKRKISKKRFDEMIARGDLKSNNSNAAMVKAHVLDPKRGYYSEYCVVGKDVSIDDVEKFVTPSAEIYVAIAYESGEPSRIITTKEIWGKQRSVFDIIDKGEDYEKALDEQVSNLKNRIAKTTQSNKALAVGRWIGFIPAAMLAAWIGWIIINLLGRFSLAWVGITSEDFIGKLYFMTAGNAAMGVAFVYVGAKIAPDHRVIVTFILGGIAVLSAGFSMFPAFMIKDWWSLWGGLYVAVGAGVAVWLVNAGETDIK